MSILLIYHNKERDRAEKLGQSLENRGYNISYAPIGLQVGTPEWKAVFENDIVKADANLLLLTRLSVMDEWVAWRLGEVFRRKLWFVPIVLDEELPDRSTWKLPQEVHKYNWLWFYSEHWEACLGMLERWLPNYSITVSCFVSYSRANEKIVKRLKSELQAENIKVWRDVDDIPAGTTWDDQIAQAIISCSHVIFIVTSQSVSSQNVADEISFARENNKPIIPLIFENVKLPLRVHRSQAIDFTNNYNNAFERLVNNLKGKI